MFYHLIESETANGKMVGKGGIPYGRLLLAAPVRRQDL